MDIQEAASLMGTKGSKNRWKKATAKEKSEHGKRMVEARWKKRKSDSILPIDNT